MSFDGYDFIITSGILGVGSAFFFAKSYLFPSFLTEAARTFLGSNPFQLRNGICQRWEAVAGVAWAAVGLVLLVLGTIRTVRGGREGYLVTSWLAILFAVAVGAAAWIASAAIVGRLSRREYLPRMIEMQCGVFDAAAQAISNSGLRAEEVRVGLTLSAEQRQQRVDEAARRLDQAGKLIDLPRTQGESDLDFLKRLTPFFERKPER